MSGHPSTVMIAMVETGSLASRTIKSGDILVKVNDTYVLDRDAARQLLFSSISANKQVTLTIERAIGLMSLGPSPPPPSGARTTVAATSNISLSKEKSSTMTAALTVNKYLDQSLPADVLEILSSNKNFYKVACALPPCLIKSKETGTLKVDDGKLEVQIPYDPSPKPLQTTPKRLGS
ncbi:unnamed protein product [Caenorhabditis auriculariae]|uniref:PDZ domain-containing protein n=1 Tax=Caenorhabditis auriculariae TaxID=2777116 RepID=A0A8S1HHR9_9PELO|nr:unnamed protein product [Caenorhabditis auriculariae]